MLKPDKREVSPEVVTWPTVLQNGDEITYQAVNTRRERTGMHAKIYISYKGKAFASDTFNVGRAEEARRLARQAESQLPTHVTAPSPQGMDYNVNLILADLQQLCNYLDDDFEADQVEIGPFDPNTTYMPALARLYPWILNGAGTSLAAPGGSGKSYLALVKAITLATGDNRFWPVVQSPALYINLERSKESFGWREQRIREILGINGPSGVDYIHARGYTLRTVLKAAQRWEQDNPSGVVFVDSISRAATGSLNEDQTANLFINAMNSLKCSWYALGHTPQDNASKLYGNSMFINGVDVGISVETATYETDTRHVRILKLVISKANDILTGQPYYIALDFDLNQNIGLIDIRQTTESEVPVEQQGQLSTKEAIKIFLMDKGQLTASQLVDMLKKEGRKVWQSNISRLLNDDEEFVKLGKIGPPGDNGVYFGLADEFDASSDPNAGNWFAPVSDEQGGNQGGLFS